MHGRARTDPQHPLGRDPAVEQDARHTGESDRCDRADLVAGDVTNLSGARDPRPVRGCRPRHLRGVGTPINLAGAGTNVGIYVDGFYSRPTIDASIYPWYHSTGSWNTTLWNYKNADMDKLLEGARAARSEAEQKSYYVRFQQLALEDPPGVIPYVINHMNAYRKNVKGFHSSPMMWLDLRTVSVQ